MNSNGLLLALCCLVCLLPPAQAATAGDDTMMVKAGFAASVEVPPARPQHYELLEPDGLSLGMAVVSSKGIMLGESARTRLVPCWVTRASGCSCAD